MIVSTQPVDPTLPAATGSDEVSAQRISTYVQLTVQQAPRGRRDSGLAPARPPDPARRPAVVAKVFQAAQPPRTSSLPRPGLYVTFGIVLGLLIGFGAAVLRNSLDTGIKSRSQELEEILGAPVLGIIGRDRRIRSAR